ncbi:uncharacterized protein LOC144473762 [Augochlora pura]
MVDLQGRDKGNISLSQKLQSYENGVAKAQPTIINMQRAFYDIRIEDIENKKKRLNDRNDELLEGVEITNEQLLTVDAETADEIATLSKQVNSQNNRIETLKNNINKLENDRIRDMETHIHLTQLCQQKYTRKKLELVSQIKILINKYYFLDAKINSLDDFKKVQDPMQKKLEENKERMIKYEEEVKDILEEIKRKFEFDQEMLKLELYQYLLNLAAHFQIETNKFISLPNKRLMRENIMLQKELLQLSKEVTVKRNIETDYKNTFAVHRKSLTTKCTNTKRNIVTFKVQNSVLKALQSKFEQMKDLLSDINVPDPTTISKLLVAIENVRWKERTIEFLLSKVHTLLHKEKLKINIAKYLQRRLECKIKAAVETLFDVKYAVARLLKCPKIQTNYPKLLLCFQCKVSRGLLKIQCNTFKSIESIPQEIECRMEDLKDVPEDIDFEILTPTEESTLSYREVLDKVIKILFHYKCYIFISNYHLQITSESSGEEQIDMSTESSAPGKKVLDDIFDTISLSDEEEYEFAKETESSDDEEQSPVIAEE